VKASVLGVWTDRPLPAATLTRLERAELAALPGAELRRQWLTSRHALRVLLGLLGLPRDTTRYRFPHRRLSLSHASTGAIAVGSVGPWSAQPWAAGLGVDYEADRPVDPRTARFFLDEAEQARLARVPRADRAAEQLRLWTVKEAVFKADLTNAGAMLRDYTVCRYSTRPAPAVAVGWAARRGTGQSFGFARRGARQWFGFASARFHGGHLSVAAAHRGPPAPAAGHCPDPTERSARMPVTFELVAERISETLNIPVTDLSPATTLRDLAADSFMLVEMAVDLQEEFDAVFTAAELREVANLGQLIGLLQGPAPAGEDEPDG
jgi:acyl carrier protein/phosphopantetheinyl transferase